MIQVPARLGQALFPLPDTDAAAPLDRDALEQQRIELLSALAAAERSIKTFADGSLEQIKAKARVTRLHNALRLVRGKLGLTRPRLDLGDLLIEVCRERATPTEWQRIVAEARRRHDANKASAEAGTTSDDSELG